MGTFTAVGTVTEALLRAFSLDPETLQAVGDCVPLAIEHPTLGTVHIRVARIPTSTGETPLQLLCTEGDAVGLKLASLYVHIFGNEKPLYNGVTTEEATRLANEWFTAACMSNLPTTTSH